MQTYKYYEDLTEAILGVGETVKIIEKISAGTARSLEDQVDQMKKYIQTIEMILARLLIFYRNNQHPLLKNNSVHSKRALVIITGQKGLVGGLWQEVLEKFFENKNRYQALIVIGEKGKNKLQGLHINVNKFFVHPIQKEWSLSSQIATEGIMKYVLEHFYQGDFETVDVLYPQFHSLINQSPIITPLLPFQFDFKDSVSGDGLPVFEQSKKRIFGKLLDKYIHSFFSAIILEAKLSELSARTVSMEYASNTTDKLIKKLNFQYHKNRRMIITQRQLENFNARRGLLSRVIED